MSKQIDYSLYLVTGRELLPPGKDYYESLEESLQGGVTIVQIREKVTETREFVEIAAKSKAICDKYNVPLIINDRVDVALAVNASGVHVGQTDMPVDVVKRLLPIGSIVGVSCNNLDHVKVAVNDGVDYIGIGSVWSTKTKSLTSPLVGVRGVGVLLDALEGTGIKAVAIGGIKSTNLLRTLYGAVSQIGHILDGVAVVSDIVASQNPQNAAANLSAIIHKFKAQKHIVPAMISTPLTSEGVLKQVLDIFAAIKKTSPLIHQITNTVVSTQSANITLALGASPIMATSAKEMQDLSKIPGALLVNIGTLVDDTKEGMLASGLYANLARKPVVLDPVGVGASQYRKDTINELLDTWQVSVIKGNAGELAALSGTSEVESKGVDSVGDGFKDPISFVRNLARKERCVVVLTGKVDYVSDGKLVVALHNGHEMLGRITGSGCMAGSCIASFCAGQASLPHDDEIITRGFANQYMLCAAVGGITVLNVAAEMAVASGNVRGTGTFLSALTDALCQLSPADIVSHASIRICT
ncbi:Thiamine biosynthetic bifunctional enzyme Thi4 [Pleurotus pulmonarius]